MEILPAEIGQDIDPGSGVRKETPRASGRRRDLNAPPLTTGESQTKSQRPAFEDKFTSANASEGLLIRPASRNILTTLKAWNRLQLK